MKTIEELTAELNQKKELVNTIEQEIEELKIRRNNLKKQLGIEYPSSYEEEVEALYKENSMLRQWLVSYDFTDNIERKHLWGHEMWIVNNSLYCAKMLVLTNPNVISSVHKHSNKCETFIGCEGEVILLVERGEKIIEVKITPGITYSIPSNIYHSFYGEGSILEVSTPDTDDNVKKIPARERV